MKKKILYFLFFLCFIIFSNFLTIKLINKDFFLSFLIDTVPYSWKQILKDKSYFFLNSKKIMGEIHNLKKINTKILSQSNGLVFQEIKPFYFEINGQNYIIKKYKTEFLTFSKHEGSIGNSYIDTFEDNLILVTANGIINKINEKQFDTKFISEIISSNINKFIDQDLYSLDNYFGIKDILIDKEKLYISFINELETNCFTIKIIRADINYKYLLFENFYETKSCINSMAKGEVFMPQQSGGRMIGVGQSIILTTGDFRHRYLAQDLKSEFGKILSIDKLSQKSTLISMGHRNPQGLLHHNKKLISTEHGPKGGDEINFIDFSNDEIENFGWPVSSYGEHYGYTNKIGYSEIYKKFPLYKSHESHGFIEPIVYFNPSIGISEIINSSFFNDKEQLVFGSLGRDIQKGQKTLYIANYSDTQIDILNKINLDERIRDLVEVNQKIYLFLETSASIGIISKYDGNTKFD